MRGQGGQEKSQLRSKDAGEKLLTREEFVSQVSARDKTCVNCGNPGIDVHHVIDRKLYPDGGYYLSNGVFLCSECHLKAEETLLSVEDLREKAGIKNPQLPPTFEEGEKTDKWGNPILSQGRRARGPLYNEEGCQKMIKRAGLEDLFVPFFKYPRTPHLPWSRSASSDDAILIDTSHFENKDVVVTLKEDGENTTMYRNHMHARSLDSGYHQMRTMMESLHARVKYDIPEGWRICGENLQGEHAIKYNNAPVFMVFSIWNDQNECLSFEETRDWAELLNLPLVTPIYEGQFSQELIEKAWEPLKENGPEYSETSEGYVVRLAGKFNYSDFAKSVAKNVRKGHVPGNEHWSKNPKQNGVYLP